MYSIVPTRLLRVSGLLLAGAAFLALGTDVGFARHRHHHSGKSDRVASDTQKANVSAPTTASPPFGKADAGEPGPRSDTGQEAKPGTDRGDKSTFERPGKKLPKTGDFSKGADAPTQIHFHSQAHDAGAKGGARPGTASPIDLSITVQQARWPKKTVKPAGAKKTVNAGPTEHFRKPKETLAPVGKFGPPRNAVGVTLGGSTPPTHTGTGPAVDLTAKNAVGGVGKPDAGPAAAELSHQSPGPATPGGTGPVVHQGFSSAGAAGANHGAIAGNVIRPGSGPGLIGGVAKNVASINGTTTRPKRCIGGC
jgi:hypothetical protein